MTISQVCSKAKLQIKKTSRSPQLDAEILLSFVLNKPKEFLYANPDYHLTQNQRSKFQTLISRRAAGLPIAYLVGHKEFYGLDFIINKNVLIPRPETELMVDEVLNHLRFTPCSLPLTLIDIGTGSGCIPIAIAKNMNTELRIMIYGTDISTKALPVARQNAKFHKVEQKIKFIQSDLLKNILNSLFIIHNSFIIITANLPYLTPAQYRANPNLKYEPRQALIAGPYGLKYYHVLIQQTKTLTRTTHYSLPITLFLEIDPSQTKKIQKVIHHHLPNAQISLKKDLSGRNRLVIIKLNHK
ncbi:peptide chain release factor N(5)-glutamine methyltransferase [Candidatus Kuenenbacteria bacterium]|nr:peptide chain release factor N(5)-glutamine methyltransferase [Candidatus Kuenenbacteria bacterium]